MKIRIKGNSIRYRLTQSEIAQLWSDGQVEERTELAGNPFGYVIKKSSGQEEILSARFIDNKIVMSVPIPMIDELYHTGKVGFSHHEGSVRLLVEKDFACIDNTEEDQSDNYPNPRGSE